MSDDNKPRAVYWGRPVKQLIHYAHPALENIRVEPGGYEPEDTHYVSIKQEHQCHACGDGTTDERINLSRADIVAMIKLLQFVLDETESDKETD